MNSKYKFSMKTSYLNIYYYMSRWDKKVALDEILDIIQKEIHKNER